MKYTYASSRNNKETTTFSKAVLNGLSDDGGLYVPLELNSIQLPWHNFINYSYQEIAVEVLKVFASDFTEEEIKSCVDKAYSNTFITSEVIDCIEVNNQTIVKLYEGPTCAFKDVALQLLPQLLQVSMKKNNFKGNILILTATSGDTGKAALEGFKDVENISIDVLYPKGLVSQIQEHQMVSTTGNNTNVIGVTGNFDDCQQIVKEIFNDTALNDEFKNHGITLSSANSINIGRLCPQVVYYFASYMTLVKNGTIQMNDEVNFAVPTGNFGNILAGYYAKCLGLPIGKLICASNENNVLTDFINTGVYNKNRPLKPTISPSMDILVSSNVERLLFELLNQDSNQVQQCMDDLKNKQQYTLNEKALHQLNDCFYADYCDNEQTKSTINDVYTTSGYVCDPHTAVAIEVANRYQQQTNDSRPLCVLSTASCYKFANDVLQAINNKSINNEFEAMETLSTLSSEPIPTSLATLKQLAILHTKETSVKDAIQFIKEDALCGKY